MRALAGTPSTAMWHENADPNYWQVRIEMSLLRLQEKGFSAHGSYALSKIAMMAFTAKLAKRLQRQGRPTVNCLDPGTVNTKMLFAGWGACGMPVSVSVLAPCTHSLQQGPKPALFSTSWEYNLQAGRALQLRLSKLCLCLSARAQALH